MQPHDDDKRPSESDPDRRRDFERRAAFDAYKLAIQKVLNVDNGSVHLKNAAVNLSASVTGSGRVNG